MDAAVSVLIVDDSALMRNIISRMVESKAGLKVADRAMNGVFALQKIPRCEPDVIVLDLEMPEMNGIEFLRERKKRGIDIPVVILSSIARRGAEITMEALALGASDFIMKPSGPASEDVHTVSAQLTDMLLVYGSQYRTKKGKTVTKVHPEDFGGTSREEEKIPIPQFPRKELSRGVLDGGTKQPRKTLTQRGAGAVDLIAIGISTGGPNALREVFAQLDPDLPQPIVVVQHMPPGFTAEFAKSLDRVCPLDVKEAEDGDLLKKGRILIAPGDKHIEVERRALASVARLSDAPPMNGHRPSADVLFASAAKEFGARTLAIIMTGMGRDGAREIGSIMNEGGVTIGQDEASSIVYGMPKVAWEQGNVMEQVPLDKMAERICKLAKELH